MCNCYLGYVKLFLSKLSHNNLFLDITLYEAEINKGNYEIFKNNFSSHRLFMYAYETKKWHVGCFTGSHEELIEKAYKDSSNKGDYYKEYVNLVKRLENMRGKM